jgi:hypothetical protein
LKRIWTILKVLKRQKSPFHPTPRSPSTSIEQWDPSSLTPHVGLNTGRRGEQARGCSN